MIPASVGFQCPECVAGGRRTQRQARTHFGGTLDGQQGLVTKTLIGINAAVMVLTVVFGSIEVLRGGYSQLHFLGSLTGPSFCTGAGEVCDQFYRGVDDGAYYRLVTSMFLHYGVVHLLLNMYALFVLGRPLEAALGRLRFAALYLVAGIGGGVAAYYFSPDGLTAGASGAIYGLFAAFFIVMRRLGRDVSGVIVVIVINVLFTLFVPGISIAGHFGGLVTGAVVAAGMAYAPREHRNLVQAVVTVGVLAGLIALTLVRAATV